METALYIRQVSFRLIPKTNSIFQKMCIKSTDYQEGNDKYSGPTTPYLQKDVSLYRE